MKKLHLLKTLFLLCALVVGSLNGWAGTVQATKTEGFETATTGTNYQGNVTVTENKSDCSIGWSIYFGNVQTSTKKTGSNAAQMRWYSSKSDKFGYIQSTTAIDGLKSVSFAVKASDTAYKYDVSYSTNGSSWTAIATGETLANTNFTTKSYNVPSGGKYIKISTNAETTSASANIQLTIDDVVFTYEYESSKTPTTLSWGTNNYSFYQGEAYTLPTLTATPAAIAGDVTYESSNTSVASVAANGTVTINGVGSTIITASYAGNATYEAASDASYTLNVYGVYNSLEDVHSAVTTTDANVKYTFANEYITFVDTQKKNIYISDGTRGMVLYNNTAYTSDAIVVGARLSGTIATILVDYSGTVEFKSISNANLAALISGSTTVTAATKDVNAIAKANQGLLVKIEGVTYDATAGTFSDGVNTIKFSTKFYNPSPALTDGAEYNITGIVVMNSNQVNIAPRNADDIDLLSTEVAPTSAWYTTNTKETALTSTTINKAGGNVSYFFDTNSTGAITYESSNTAVATVNETTGVITPQGYGTTTITANTAAVSGTWFSSSASFTLTVKDDGVDVLIADLIGVTSYSDWADIVDNTGAVYAGNSTKGNNAIQLRKSTGEQAKSGIITTTSGGKAQNVSVEWESHTQADRTINIYGKNTPYTEAADLYDDNKKGTLLGTIVKGTSSECDITGSYAYIGLVSNDGALYASQIVITWNENVMPITISDAGLATFASDKKLDFSGVTNLEAYIATESGSDIILTKKNKIAAGTGVLLRSKTGAATFDVPVTTADADVTTGNLFVRGTGTAVAATADGKNNYLLAKRGEEVAFFKANGTKTVATNQAYLATTLSAGARINLNFDADEATAIINVKSEVDEMSNATFNLAGQRVAQPTKGLYIVNGKKVIMK